MKQICMNCPERCLLTEKIRECAQVKSKLWLDRSAILCRTCPNIEEECSDCTRVGNTDMGRNIKRNDVGIILPWNEMSAMLWDDYKKRHPEFKPKGESKKW